jgi:hypothetical protein
MPKRCSRHRYPEGLCIRSGTFKSERCRLTDQLEKFRNTCVAFPRSIAVGGGLVCFSCRFTRLPTLVSYDPRRRCTKSHSSSSTSQIPMPLRIIAQVHLNPDRINCESELKQWKRNYAETLQPLHGELLEWRIFTLGYRAASTGCFPNTGHSDSGSSKMASNAFLCYLCTTSSVYNLKSL